MTKSSLRNVAANLDCQRGHIRNQILWEIFLIGLSEVWRTTLNLGVMPSGGRLLKSAWKKKALTFGPLALTLADKCISVPGHSLLHSFPPTAPPSPNQVFKYTNLWGTFLIETDTRPVPPKLVFCLGFLFFETEAQVGLKLTVLLSAGITSYHTLIEKSGFNQV